MYLSYLSYFVAIVETGYNLTAAAKQIHISQSALSKATLTFEQEQKVKLFVRSNGRLVKLTSEGELFYHASKDIIARYEQLLEDIEAEAKKRQGVIRIGIPQLVLMVLCADLITQFKLQFPNIDIVITEVGSEVLKQKLLDNELDFAILLSPSGLNPSDIVEHVMYQDRLVAFVSVNNPFAQKDRLEWEDLDNQDIVLANESFTIYHLIIDKLQEYNAKPNIALKSDSYDFLLKTVENSNFITILPAPISNYIDLNKIKLIQFSDPIKWTVTMLGFNRKMTLSQKTFFEYTCNYPSGSLQIES